MHTVTVISVGKNKETWLEMAWQEYSKRLRPHLQLQTLWLPSMRAFNKCVYDRPDSILLDPEGALLDSLQLHSYMYKHAMQHKGQINLVIGPDCGFDIEVKKQAYAKKQLLSLSKLTLTHQMCRILLLEQIYRCTQIEAGTPYHK